MGITRLTTSRHWLCPKIELYGPNPGYLQQFLSLGVRVQTLTQWFQRDS